MQRRKMNLLIPVENQMREFDSKLLLACVAAQRGFQAVIGPIKEMDFRITSFPKSIYLSKSFRDTMFPIIHKLGHVIVSWDEDALVHLPDEIFFSRRLSPIAIRYVSHLFAWGEDNAELWRRYPHLPADMPIHVTGNPRIDMLRPQLHAYYADEVRGLREAFGDFILVNTNFNHVNAFVSSRNLFKSDDRQDRNSEFGRSGRGMTQTYAEGLRDHKQVIFEHFQRLIPILDTELTDQPHTIIVRPHPTESKEIYERIAAGCRRVTVSNEGNIVPWLLGAKALIHNGCTTGVEAYAVGVPAISYRARVNELFDCGFYRLPNGLSHQCFDIDQLSLTLRRILSGELGVAEGEAPKALFQHYVTALDGPLACERIVEVLETIDAGTAASPHGSVRLWLEGHVQSAYRNLKRFYKRHLPNAADRPEFQRLIYRGVSMEELRLKMTRLQKIIGGHANLKAEPLASHLFRIST
jgi:surface carbohydrate biosynthesis protein